MAESVHEQIAAGLAAAFAAIVADGGASFWYTPDKVGRVTFYTDSLLRPEYSTLYVLRPGDENHREETSSGGVSVTAEFFVLIAKKLDVASEDPFDPARDTPTRETVVNRVVRDAVKTLWANVQLGGIVNGTVENIVTGSLFVERSAVELADVRWALAELRFEVLYSYLKGTP